MFLVVAGAVAGLVERRAQAVSRAKCSACRVGFTCYPPGLYPRRQYQLDVVAESVAAVALGGQSVAQLAAQATASRTSVRRWTRWVAALADVAALCAAAAQVDPDAPAGAGLSVLPATGSVSARAGLVLSALEQLGQALGRAGVALVERTGLARVLGWQHRVHGDAVHLTVEPRTLSPPMALGLAGAGR